MLLEKFVYQRECNQAWALPALVKLAWPGRGESGKQIAQPAEELQLLLSWAELEESWNWRQFECVADKMEMPSRWLISGSINQHFGPEMLLTLAASKLHAIKRK